MANSLRKGPMNGMGEEKVLGYSSAELVLLQNGMHGKQTKKRTNEGNGKEENIR